MISEMERILPDSSLFDRCWWHKILRVAQNIVVQLPFSDFYIGDVKFQVVTAWRGTDSTTEREEANYDSLEKVQFPFPDTFVKEPKALPIMMNLSFLVLTNELPRYLKYLTQLVIYTKLICTWIFNFT